MMSTREHRRLSLGEGRVSFPGDSGLRGMNKEAGATVPDK